jgi:hypothetical protein
MLHRHGVRQADTVRIEYVIVKVSRTFYASKENAATNKVASSGAVPHKASGCICPIFFIVQSINLGQSEVFQQANA